MSAPFTAACDALAGLLRYPAADYGERVRACREMLAAVSPRAAGEIAAFADGIAALEESGVEELFTRVFDLNPVCCLDLGWHLYGQAYERGRFLVRLRGLLREHGVAENGELPDHASHVLPLLGRMEVEAAGELARDIAPALDKMCAAVAAGAENSYGHVLEAARIVVREALVEGGEEVCV